MNLFTEADEALRSKPSKANYDQAVKLAHHYWDKKTTDTSSIEYLTGVEFITVGEKVNLS